MGKIKTWCNENVAITRVEIVLCAVFGIGSACAGDIGSALIWAVCVFAWLKCDFVERQCRNIGNTAADIGALNTELLNKQRCLIDRLDLEESKHFLTFLRMEAYQNDVAFCKREKSCSEHLSYKQKIEEAIACADEKVRKLSDEYNKKYGVVIIDKDGNATCSK